MEKSEQHEKLKHHIDTIKTTLDSENSLSQNAYEIMKIAIRELIIQPGDIFLEQEIADILDISRTPTREALIRLDYEGWIEMKPRRGLIVSQIKAEEISEITLVNMVLEGIAAHEATSNITKDQLNHLIHLTELQSEHAKNMNHVEYVKVDHQFHTSIVKWSNNVKLINTIENLSDQVYRARLYTIDDRSDLTQSINEHKALIAAMQSKNKETARLTMEIHRKNGTKEILKILKDINH